MPGTILGAFMSDVVTPVIFQILFALVLVSSAVYIFLKRKLSEKPYNLKNTMMVFAAGASFFAGIISSFFGIGGGAQWTGASIDPYNNPLKSIIIIYI